MKYLPGRYTESGVKNLIYKDQIWDRCTSNAATFKINNYKKPPYGAKCVRKGDRWCASFVGNLPRTVTTSEGVTAHTHLNLAFLINDAKLMFHDPIQLILIPLLNVISADSTPRFLLIIYIYAKNTQAFQRTKTLLCTSLMAT